MLALLALLLATELGFSSGMQPLDVNARDLDIDAASCGACHAKEHREWSASRHRYAWSNALFLEGYASEPKQRCVNCHAPLVEQAREVGPRKLRPPPGALAHEGITCAVCHVRDGAVLTASPVDGSMHRVRSAPELRNAELCKQCHEFAFTGRDTMMQTTWSEWRAYVAAGGTKSCVDCHVPHKFPGAHDEAFLRRSIDAQLVGNELILRSRDVGHALPTGDLFRHLTVEVDGVVVATIGRRWSSERELLEDTRLMPNEVRRIPIDGDVRVRYHYATAAHEEKRVLPMHTLVVDVWP